MKAPVKDTIRKSQTWQTASSLPFEMNQRTSLD